jgi:hypothetical protein
VNALVRKLCGDLRCVLGCLPILLTSCASERSRLAVMDVPESRLRISSIVLTNVVFSDADVGAVMASISEAILVQTGAGVRIITTLQWGDRPYQTGAVLPRIRFCAASVDFPTLLDAVCKQAGLRWWLLPDCILIGPEADNSKAPPDISSRQATNELTH